MATRLRVEPTRIVLDLLKARGPLTRNQIIEATSREAIPSMSHLGRITRYLRRNNRIKPIVPRGYKKGIDHFKYKLNPMAEKKNFPHLHQSKNNSKMNELQMIINMDTIEPLFQSIESQEASPFEEDTEAFDPTEY